MYPLAFLLSVYQWFCSPVLGTARSASRLIRPLLAIVVTFLIPQAFEPYDPRGKPLGEVFPGVAQSPCQQEKFFDEEDLPEDFEQLEQVERTSPITRDEAMRNVQQDISTFEHDIPAVAGVPVTTPKRSPSPKRPPIDIFEDYEDLEVEPCVCADSPQHLGSPRLSMSPESRRFAEIERAFDVCPASSPVQQPPPGVCPASAAAAAAAQAQYEQLLMKTPSPRKPAPCSPRGRQEAEESRFMPDDLMGYGFAPGGSPCGAQGTDFDASLGATGLPSPITPAKGGRSGWYGTPEGPQMGSQSPLSHDMFSFASV